MKIIGNYHENGYCHLESLMPVEVAQAFLQGLKQDIGPGAIPLSRVTSHPNLLRRAAYEVCGHHYEPILGIGGNTRILVTRPPALRHAAGGGRGDISESGEMQR